MKIERFNFNQKIFLLHCSPFRVLRGAKHGAAKLLVWLENQGKIQTKTETETESETESESESSDVPVHSEWCEVR